MHFVDRGRTSRDAGGWRTVGLTIGDLNGASRLLLAKPRRQEPVDVVTESPEDWVARGRSGIAHVAADIDMNATMVGLVKRELKRTEVGIVDRTRGFWAPDVTVTRDEAAASRAAAMHRLISQSAGQAAIQKVAVFLSQF